MKKICGIAPGFVQLERLLILVCPGDLHTILVLGFGAFGLGLEDLSHLDELLGVLGQATGPLPTDGVRQAFLVRVSETGRAWSSR